MSEVPEGFAAVFGGVDDSSAMLSVASTSAAGASSVEASAGLPAPPACERAAARMSAVESFFLAMVSAGTCHGAVFDQMRIFGRHEVGAERGSLTIQPRELWHVKNGLTSGTLRRASLFSQPGRGKNALPRLGNALSAAILTQVRRLRNRLCSSSRYTSVSRDCSHRSNRSLCTVRLLSCFHRF